jgi:hypothetical protein
MLTPSSSTAMFCFYTNVLHYSFEFMGAIKFLFSLATIGSILFYKRYLKNVPFAKMFAISSVLFSMANALTILLVTRKTVDLGIPDPYFSLFDTVVLQIVAEINTLPILILACKMCPPNIEGF